MVFSIYLASIFKNDAFVGVDVRCVWYDCTCNEHNTPHESKTMKITRSQKRTISELKQTFGDAKCTITEAVKGVLVSFVYVTPDCQNRYVNLFKVGVRGGLTIIKQEFNQHGFKVVK